jgi:hypothetical protein
MNDIITALFIGIEFLFKNIRKEKYFQDKKDNNQFNDNDDPKIFTDGHIPETIIIEVIYLQKSFLHRSIVC